MLVYAVESTTKRMNAILLPVLAGFFALSLGATEPPGYYASAQGKTGESLRQSLHDIISTGSVLHYGDTPDALKVLDEDPADTNNVILVYSGYSMAKTNYGPSSGWNREHLWPNSYGFDIDILYKTTWPPLRDLHNLRACDSTVNSARQNEYYDVSDPTDPRYMNPAHAEAPLCSTDTDSWEPRTEDKGRVARAIFYMAVRYTGDQTNEPALKLTDDSNLITNANPCMGRLSTLLRWNATYPVDAQEQLRNDRIYSLYQTNRNPFVDHPEWVNLAFAPTLQITVAGTNLFVEWSADFRGAALESSPALPPTWDMVANTATVTNSTWRATIPFPDSPRYWQIGQMGQLGQPGQPPATIPSPYVISRA